MSTGAFVSRGIRVDWEGCYEHVLYSVDWMYGVQFMSVTSDETIVDSVGLRWELKIIAYTTAD